MCGSPPGWELADYPAVSLVDPSPGPWVGEPASMLSPAQLSWWAATAPLAAIHVAALSSEGGDEVMESSSSSVTP